MAEDKIADPKAIDQPDDDEPDDWYGPGNTPKALTLPDALQGQENLQHWLRRYLVPAKIYVLY